jgi:hypothetical protein
MREAMSEKSKEQISKKIAILSEKKRKYEEKIRDNMAKAGANTIAWHEAKNQVWYYNDIIENITKKNGRTYYIGDSLVIDTYNPLFKMNGMNERGTVRVKCNPKDPNSVLANSMQYASQSDEFMKQNPDFCKPNGDMKGLLEMWTDLLWNKSNMTSKQAEFWKGAAKLGSVVWLWYVAWNVLKGIFGGKDTKVFWKARWEWNRWKWIVGAVWATVGMQALTGENPMSFTYKLLNGGLDSKTLSKIPGIESFLSGMKRNPELNNHVKNTTGMSMLFPGTSFGEVMRRGDIVRWESEGKVSSNKQWLINYYNSILNNPSLPQWTKESYTIALASIQNMTDQQFNDLINGGMNAANIKTKTQAENISDYNKHAQEYLNQQAEAAREIKDPIVKSLMWAYATPDVKETLTLNGSREINEEEAVKLQMALIELQKKDPNAKLVFSKEHGLMLATSNGDVPLKMTIDGKWQVAGFNDALFTSPEHAIRVASLTAFFTNHFKGRVPNGSATPWMISGGDLTFGDNNKAWWLNGRLRKTGWWTLSSITAMIPWSSTEALDGDDWKYVWFTGSTMKDMWGDLFESQIGAYATYLNNLKNNNGKSIWTPEGTITSIVDIKGYLPTWKQKSIAAPSNTPSNTPANKNTDTEKKPDDKKDNSLINPNTDTDKIKDAIKDANETQKDVVVDKNAKEADEKLIKERAAMWKKEFDPYYLKQIKKEMPIAFYEAWSEAYGKDGNYKLDFVWNNTPYWRQWWDLPPTRHLPKAQKTWSIGNLK